MPSTGAVEVEMGSLIQNIYPWSEPNANPEIKCAESKAEADPVSRASKGQRQTRRIQQTGQVQCHKGSRDDLDWRVD